jgi:glycosyltransferase involved in cell wall biosynthesis
LAAGRPVVAFAEGGVADTVRDGEGGVVFSQATPEALAAALDRLEGNAFAPDRLRALARRFDRDEFERRIADWIDGARRAREVQPQ